MTRWIKVSAVALAAVVGLIPAFAQLSYGQAVSVQQVPVTLPQGDELSDAELLRVDGEADPLTWLAAGVVTAGVGAGLDLVTQGIQIARGKQSGINWEEVGMAAGVSLLAIPLNLTAPATVVLRSAIVTGARWTAQAVAAVGAAAVATAEKAGHVAVSLGHRAHEALHTTHVALHNYVREPVTNFFRSAWNWLTRR